MRVTSPLQTVTRFGPVKLLLISPGLSYSIAMLARRGTRHGADSRVCVDSVPKSAAQAHHAHPPSRALSPLSSTALPSIAQYSICPAVERRIAITVWRACVTKALGCLSKSGNLRYFSSIQIIFQ